MNVQTVFRKIATKLAADFDLTAEVEHDGSKGALREDALREFLDVRLPGICAIGSGEIVGPRNETSQQCDLIMYDRLRGVPLIYGESSQVYPIECVYGTVEVKSGLSKTKLIDGLEKIKSVKALVPNETIVVSRGPGLASAIGRPRPFGIVFAYRLDGNSLASLADNLKDWEATVEPEYWPNLVVVLHEGVILHVADEGQLLLRNDDFRSGQRNIPLGYGEDSLFHAYAAILDMVAATPLGPPNIRRYYDLPKLVGRYSVKNHDSFIDTKTNRPMRLNNSFIERVVSWCAGRPKLSRADVMLKTMGQLPAGGSASDYADLIHFYDPENLPGFHEVDEPWATNEDGTPKTRTQSPNWLIVVDGETYWFAQAYISRERDFETY